MMRGVRSSGFTHQDWGRLVERGKLTLVSATVSTTVTLLTAAVSTAPVSTTPVPSSLFCNKP
jgi:hypothetical protein